MKKPVALTLLYALTLGTVMALENVVDIPDVFLLAVWLLAPVVGYLSGAVAFGLLLGGFLLLLGVGASIARGNGTRRRGLQA
jgi:hypothetical protein